MVQEHISAFAKRRRLNHGSASSASISHTENSPVALVASLESQSEPIQSHSLSINSDADVENTFDVLADEENASSRKTKEVDIVDSRSVKVRFSGGQECVVVGAFHLWVKTGVVRISGAELRSSTHSYPVYNLPGYDLQKIVCISESSELQLETLKGEFWDLPAPFPYSWSTPSGSPLKLSFEVLDVSVSPRSERYSTIDVSTIYGVCRELATTGSTSTPPRMIVHGRRYEGIGYQLLSIINQLLTVIGPNGKNIYPSGVLLLDYDLSIQLFGLPGTVTLVHITEPIFGPASIRGNGASSTAYEVKAMKYVGVEESAIKLQFQSDPLIFSENQLATTLKHAEQDGCPVVVSAWDWFDAVQPEQRTATRIRDQLRPTALVCLNSGYEVGANGIGEMVAQAAGLEIRKVGVFPSKEPTIAQQHEKQMQHYFRAHTHDEAQTHELIEIDIRDVAAIHYAGRDALEAPPITMLSSLSLQFIAIMHSSPSKAERSNADTNWSSRQAKIGRNHATEPARHPERDRKPGKDESCESQEFLGLGLVYSVDLEQGILRMRSPIGTKEHFSTKKHPSGQYQLIVQPEHNGKFNKKWILRSLSRGVLDREGKTSGTSRLFSNSRRYWTVGELRTAAR